MCVKMNVVQKRKIFVIIICVLLIFAGGIFAANLMKENQVHDSLIKQIKLEQQKIIKTQQETINKQQQDIIEIQKSAIAQQKDSKKQQDIIDKQKEDINK